MKKVLLAGNSTTADILYSYLQGDDRYQVAGLTVDDKYLESGTIDDVKSIGISQVRDHFSPDDHTVIMAAGYNDLNRVRESLFLRLKELGYGIETYIHPDAFVYTGHPIGEGSVFLPNAVVERHVRIGAKTMVWCNVTMSPHSEYGDHC